MDCGGHIQPITGASLRKRASGAHYKPTSGLDGLLFCCTLGRVLGEVGGRAPPLAMWPGPMGWGSSARSQGSLNTPFPSLGPLVLGGA